MSTPYESARLNLKLFELRRDPLLREARTWFLRTFHPESVDDVVAVLSGPDNAKCRMVLGYWDMAASLVGHGAIDAASFRDAHPEILATFAKVRPFLADLRRLNNAPDYLRHTERVVIGFPNAEARLQALRERSGALAEASRAQGEAAPGKT